MNQVKSYIGSEYDTDWEVISRRSRVGNGSRPQACMCEFVLRGWFSDFPWVYTCGMGLQKFWDMVQKMCEEGVNDGVS